MMFFLTLLFQENKIHPTFTHTSNSIETVLLIPVLVYTVVASESPCDPLLFHLVAWYIVLFLHLTFFSFICKCRGFMLALTEFPPLVFFSSLTENI